VTASVPMRVVDASRVVGATRVVAPHVGDARLEELFTTVGAAEGASVGPGPTLVIRRGEVTGRVMRELGPDGTRLRVHVTQPDVKLDVHVSEPALLALRPRQRKAARAAGLGDERAVVARDVAQATAWLRRISPLLSRARSIEVDDTSIRYFVPTPANDRASVSRVVREMRDLVEALTVPPPLPSALADAQHEWLELARALGGELQTGHARVVAAGTDAAVAVMTVFDDAGVPSGTTVIVRPLREMRVDRPIVLEGGTLPETTPLAPEARAAIERLARFGRVNVDAARIQVSLDVALGVTVPPSRGREIVEAGHRLAAALRPTSGPFR